MLEKTDSEFAWLLRSSRFKVSISPTSRHQISLVPRPLSSGGGGLETRLPPDLLANVTATNYALQGTCFTLCQVERAILWKQRKHRPLFSHPIFCQMHVHCQAHISLLSAVISPIPRSPPSTLQE